jgi:hypothetical protein
MNASSKPPTLPKIARLKSGSSSKGAATSCRLATLAVSAFLNHGLTVGYRTVDSADRGRFVQYFFSMGTKTTAEIDYGLERLPFTPEMRRKVRGRLRGFYAGIIFIVLCAAGFDVGIVLTPAGELHATGQLLLCLMFVAIAILLCTIVGFRARPQFKDLKLGYAVRYQGLVKMAYYEGGGDTAPEFCVFTPAKMLSTSHPAFLKIGRRDDFAHVLPYEATVEFTPTAGHLLRLRTREFGDVRA